MRIPSCFYGRTAADAKRKCARVARKVWEGVPVVEAVAEYEFLDTKEIVGAGLVVEHPFGSIVNEQHFFLTLISDIIQSKYLSLGSSIDKENEDRIFYQLIEYDWSILGLSENLEHHWFNAFGTKNNNKRHRWQPYLRKICDFWSIFCNEGERFLGRADLGGVTAWEAIDSLYHVLRLFAIQDNEIQNPLDSARLKMICEKHDLLTMDVMNNPKILEQFPFRELTRN